MAFCDCDEGRETTVSAGYYVSSTSSTAALFSSRSNEVILPCYGQDFFALKKTDVVFIADIRKLQGRHYWKTKIEWIFTLPQITLNFFFCLSYMLPI